MVSCYEKLCFSQLSSLFQSITIISSIFMLSKLVSENMQIVKRKHVINDSHIGQDDASDDNENSALHRILVNFGLKLPSFCHG